jgi:hypothetical protein
MQPGEQYMCRGNGSPGSILLMCLAQENGEMYFKIHRVELGKKEMSGIVERQLTDRSERVAA